MNKLKKQKDLNIKKQISIFNNLSLLLSKSFIKEPKSIIFMIVVPIFFNIMFFFIMGEKSGQGHSILFAYTLLPCLTILTLLAPAVVEWKNSVFLKRIDITGIRKGMFIGALWFVYLIAGIIAFILMMIFNLIFSEIYSLALNDNQPTFAKLLGDVHWGYLILSMILITLTSIALATMFGGLFSSVGSMQGMIMMVYFFSIFLSGIMLPPETFESSKGMIIFTYFIPHKYAVFIFLYATRGWNGDGWDSEFNWHQKLGDGSRDFTATWQPVLGAILILITIFIITTLTFKWTAKK
ncbi:ABC transporter permease [Spiroplasma endosymbiont of Dioctria linearis]|uniref:ABC transporter permease n=1 Tax=Spiroplasma endosymbiont of Dioctria linearis TaxID=3066290 RepID=UPI00313AA7E9